MTSVTFVVASGSCPLVARTVKLKLPAAVGVPDSPPELDSVMPAGRLQDAMLAVPAGLPPSVKAKVYAVPTVPLGGTPPIVGGAHGTTAPDAFDSAEEPALLVAVTENV